MSHLVKLLQCDSTSPSPEGKKRERSLRAGEMDAQRGVLVTEGLSGAGSGGREYLYSRDRSFIVSTLHYHVRGIPVSE